MMQTLYHFFATENIPESLLKTVDIEQKNPPFYHKKQICFFCKECQFYILMIFMGNSFGRGFNFMTKYLHYNLRTGMSLLLIFKNVSWLKISKNW